MRNNDVEIDKPKLTAYQKKMLYGDERFTITEASTKCGKTFSHLWWLFEQAVQSTKKGAIYWWVAPVYSQSMVAFKRLQRVIANKKGFTVSLNGTITFPNGAVMEFKSADKPDNLYGEDVHAIVMDEFTRCKVESFYALRSTVTKTGGKMKMIGNARGKKNWGFKLGLKARNGEPNYAYHRITIYEACEEGIISAEEIEQAKRDLPESVFRELYLAEPTEDGSNPFGIEHIKRNIQSQVEQGVPVCYGIDLAKYVDWTVIVGLNTAGRIVRYERFQMDWAQTSQRIIDVVGNVPAYIDSTGVGDAIVEGIQKKCRNVEGYKYSSTSKQQLMESLSHGIQNNLVCVLSGVMREECESFEFVYGSTGVKYSAPSGMHDDTVNALAMAYKKKITMKPKPVAPKFSY